MLQRQILRISRNLATFNGYPHSSLYNIKNSFRCRRISCRMKLLLYLLLLKFHCGLLIAHAPNSTAQSVNRTERTLFKKLHSGAAFLAGAKLGSFLKDHPPLFGSGNLAATSSLNVLGKSVSTAFSFAFGDAQQLYDPVNDTKTRMQHVIVTTVDYPILDIEALEKLKTIAKITENDPETNNSITRINSRF